MEDLGNTNPIVIVGAGPGGCACALRLHALGVPRVVLLEASPGAAFSIGESIQPDANRLLRKLGIYEAFLQEGHEPAFGTRSYWGNRQVGYNDNLLNPHGHGWHLDRAKFNSFLQEEVQKRGMEIRMGHRLVEATEEGDCLRLKVQDAEGQGYELQASYAVDASGTAAVLARRLGSPAIETPSLACLGLRYQAGKVDALPQLTHLESVPYGWWYVTRIPGEQLLVTLYSDAESIKQRKLNHLVSWRHHLQDTLHTYDYMSVAQPRIVDQKLWGFPVRSLRREALAGERWLTVGDAAATYDPITSQGILKALGQGVMAGESLAQAMQGNAGAFREYTQAIEEAYAHYLTVRAHFYRLENRWSDHPFWRKVHSERMYGERPQLA